ncbi:MAG: MFS transporter [Bacillota bacterium]
MKPNNKLNNIKNSLQWKLLLVLSTGYMGAFLNIQGVQSLMPFIRDDFGISRTQAGLYPTFFFLSATAVAIFSGAVVDKIGSKTGLLIGCFSIGGLMILHGLAPIYGVILILAFITGIGFSIITPSVNKAIMTEVKPEKRAISMGLMHSGSGFGGFTGATLLPILALQIGWRAALITSALIAVGLGLMVTKKFHPGKNNNSETSFDPGQFKGEVRELIKNRQLMLACMLGLIFGLAVGSIPAHYTLFVTLDLNYSSALAGLALGIVQIGGIFGRTFWGWVSDALLGGSRKNTFMIIIIFVFALKLIYGLAGGILSSSAVLLLFISFLLGLTALGWSGLFFTVVSERARPEQTGIASGLSLIFLRSGVVIGPPLFGMLADYFDHYFYSWLILGVFVLTAGLLYYFLQTREDNKEQAA